MKLVLKIFCILAAIYCFYFPMTYFNSDNDKKEVRISHILIDSEDKANEIRQNIIDKKYTFGNAAKEFSQCPSAKINGDLGFNGKDTIADEMKNIVFKQKKHIISDPIQTEHGWHIVKVTDIKHFSDKESFGKRY